MLGTSDAWSTIRLSHRPSEPAYYIVDCRILKVQSRRTQVQTQSPEKFHILSCFVIVFPLNIKKKSGDRV